MDKRMAGDYEIIQSFHIGDQEVVLGENVNAPPEERYMCAYCQQNEIMALYNDVQVSDDFCEIAKLYGERLAQQAEKTRVALFKPKFQGIDTTPLTKADCTPLSHEDDLNGKVVVIKAGGTSPGVPDGNQPDQALYRRIWGISPQPWLCLLLC